MPHTPLDTQVPERDTPPAEKLEFQYIYVPVVVIGVTVSPTDIVVALDVTMAVILPTGNIDVPELDSIIAEHTGLLFIVADSAIDSEDATLNVPSILTLSKNFVS